MTFFTTPAQHRALYVAACQTAVLTSTAQTVSRDSTTSPLLIRDDDSNKFLDRKWPIIVVIALCVAVVSAAVAYVCVRWWYVKHQNNQVRLLERAYQCNEMAQAEISWRRKAWEISMDHIVWGRKIAEGGVGEVWKCTWGNHHVAVKVLKKQILDVDSAAAIEFQEEAEAMQVIRHPNLLILYGGGMTGAGYPYIVTELMELGSLRGLLRSDRPISWPTRHRFAVDIARGMEHLHSLGSIHRDLKSDNCLVDKRLCIKVGDFGASRLIHSFRQKNIMLLESSHGGDVDTAFDEGHSRPFVGTFQYMAPELFLGEPAYHGEVDVYSFGVLMWELVTRRRPWAEIPNQTYLKYFTSLKDKVIRGERPHLAPGAPCSEHYRTLMEKCWSNDASQRPVFKTIVPLLLASNTSPARLLAPIVRDQTSSDGDGYYTPAQISKTMVKERLSFGASHSPEGAAEGATGVLDQTENGSLSPASPAASPDAPIAETGIQPVPVDSEAFPIDDMPAVPPHYMNYDTICENLKDAGYVRRVMTGDNTGDRNVAQTVSAIGSPPDHPGVSEHSAPAASHYE
eukprot:m.160349 g.160349  ORF g.160349 m.160349 type:complete len:568 (-) comp18022_c0_seq1:286-1989(-)